MKQPNTTVLSLLIDSPPSPFQLSDATLISYSKFKAGLYRIRCGVNRLDDSGVNTFGNTSAFVKPAGQLLLTRRGKTTMDGIDIVFEFYIAPL